MCVCVRDRESKAKLLAKLTIKPELQPFSEYIWMTATVSVNSHNFSTAKNFNKS